LRVLDQRFIGRRLQHIERDQEGDAASCAGALTSMVVARMSPWRRAVKKSRFLDGLEVATTVPRRTRQGPQDRRAMAAIVI
jgi:hypothetical protein